eukprot:826051-Pyramimonas_sp.AAC.1
MQRRLWTAVIHVLPPLAADEEGEVSGARGTGAGPAAVGVVQPSRLQWRIREIALQRMIKAASISRVSRALRA